LGDLDLEEARKRLDLFATNRQKPPKLVHKLIFSMPAGTPPRKGLAAVRDFAREEFGLKHRYAMVLHTEAARTWSSSHWPQHAALLTNNDDVTEAPFVAVDVLEGYNKR
jgi:hypothetical protein